MPRAAYWTASTRDSCITPALVAAYATCAEPVQRSPDVDAMLTMAPDFCRSMMGSTYLQVRKTLLRLESTCESHTSSAISTGPPAAEPPTLFTSTSTLPQRFVQASTIAATALASVTSH